MDIGDEDQNLNTPAAIHINIYLPLYDAGARVMSSSWGASTNDYSLDAFNSDTFMKSYPESIILYAAGNDGDEGSGSVVSPSTGKNVVSVGAGLNDYKSWKSITGTSNKSKYNLNNIASFSSKGPTSDGRIKPDIMGQGYYIKSSSADNTASAGHTSNVVFAGTSMVFENYHIE